MNDIQYEDESPLAHLRHLEINAPANHQRLTSIIYTIGHNSHTMEQIVAMIENGLNIVRLNFSHDSHEYHKETIDHVRKSVQLHAQRHGYETQVALAMDTKGPEIRTGLLAGCIWKEVMVEADMLMELSSRKKLMNQGKRNCVYVDCPQILKAVQLGTKIYINDASIVLNVIAVEKNCVICKTEAGGFMNSRCSVLVPGIDSGLPDISAKDLFDLKFAVECKIDIIFASKIRKADTIIEIRKILGKKGKDIKVIAKIDSKEALENFEEIINVSDGILLLRSNLAIELSIDEMFEAQKMIYARCNQLGKTIICATQVLQSMRRMYRPTADEIADLGNSVLNGADCVMLSSGTTRNPNALNIITTVAQICREAELALWYGNVFESSILQSDKNVTDSSYAVAMAAVDTSKSSLASIIIVITVSGRSAQLVSKYRPRCPIIAVTRCARTARQSLLYRGIFPLLYTALPTNDWMKEVDARVHYALLVARTLGLVNEGDAVIVVSPRLTTRLRLFYAHFENYAFECLMKEDAKINKNLKSASA